MKSQSIYSLTMLLALVLAATLSSCGPMDVEEALCQAEAELQIGDLSRAASSCELLSDSTVVELSPVQLCRVAIIYAKLSERTEKEDYMASAAECLDRAMDRDNDSIDAYIATLNVEDRSCVQVIREVSQVMYSPRDVYRDFDDEEADLALTNYPEQP